MSEPPTVQEAAARQALSYYDSWLAFQQPYLRVPGVQAAVLLGDQIVLSTAHGLADVERAVPLTTRHLFRIASHSKTFTATAVLQLAEQGRLRLDDTAGSWLPELTDGGSPLADVTLRELLSHASGMFRDSRDGDFWQLWRPFPDRDGLREILLSADVAVVPRHERFKYSNIGYALLGLVIEAASGQPYANQLRQSVLEPLGLRDTTPDLDPARADDYATGHSSLAYADRRVPIEQVDTAAMAAATGFAATASDLVTYFSAHFLGDDRLLTDASKRQMQQGLWAAGAEGRRYGLGMGVQTIGDRPVIGHGGGFPGHITGTVADPQARLAVSVLTNAVDGPAEPLAHAAVRLVDLACGDRARPAEAADSETTLQRFTGRFAGLWGVVDVALLGGRLFQVDATASDPTAEAVELDHVDDSTLRFAGGRGFGSYGEPLRYDFAPDGTIRSLRGSSGATLTPLDRFDLGDRVDAR